MTAFGPQMEAFTVLESGIRRLVAPNPSMMTGPGTNTYLFGREEVAVLDPGQAAEITAPGEARLALFGGDSLGRRHIWWNLVASSRERIRAAAERWAAGGFDRVPGDDEFIPLPDLPFPKP